MKLVIGNKALHFCETFVPSNGRKNVYVFLTQKINPKNHIYFFFFQIVEIHFYFIESNYFFKLNMKMKIKIKKRKKRQKMIREINQEDDSNFIPFFLKERRAKW